MSCKNGVNRHCCQKCECQQSTTGNCCCKNSVKYALDTIYNAYKTQDISLVYFNKLQTGTIVEVEPNGDVVKISDTNKEDTVYVSLCNIVFITFPKEPIIPQSQSPYNCPTPQCCCNQDMDSALKALVGTDFPITLQKPHTLNIHVLDNTANAYKIVTIYGICNGIIWVKFNETVKGNSYGAIPLCSIFSTFIKKEDN